MVSATRSLLGRGRLTRSSVESLTDNYGFSQVYNMDSSICQQGDQTPEILSLLAKRHTNFSLAFLGRKRPKILADIFAK